MTKILEAVDEKAISKNSWFSWAQGLAGVAFTESLSWAKTVSLNSCL
jgi:hypothetical protein